MCWKVISPEVPGIIKWEVPRFTCPQYFILRVSLVVMHFTRSAGLIKAEAAPLFGSFVCILKLVAQFFYYRFFLQLFSYAATVYLSCIHLCCTILLCCFSCKLWVCEQALQAHQNAKQTPSSQVEGLTEFKVIYNLAIPAKQNTKNNP